MIVYISISIALGISTIMIYLYFHHKGQFDDSEEVKYILFRDDDKNKD